jgi:hypothetical protein
MSEYEEFDDFLEDYEDDADESADSDSGKQQDVPEELSEAEQEERIAAFHIQLKRNMQIILKPKNFKPEQRKEAIRWLGEASDPTCLPALIKVYRKDKTPGIKEEAQYALGQLKAMGQALEDDETMDHAYDLMNDIVLHGKFGKRVNTGMFKLIEIGLGISAGVIFVIGIIGMLLVAMPKANEQAAVAEETAAYETRIAPTATPDTEDIVKSQLQEHYRQLLEDATNYQFQLLRAGRGESIDCDSNLFNKPANYTLSTTWAGDPRFAGIAEQLSLVIDTLVPVRLAYDNACTNQIAMAREATLELGTAVLDAQTRLRATETLLSDANIEIPLVEFASPTPPPTDIPEPTATPELSMAEEPITQIERLISDVTGARGAGTNIIFYWEQVISSNQMYREGCNISQLSIPDDIALPANIVGAFPELDLAVQNINIGLSNLRLSSTAFFTSCAEGVVPENAADRLAQANLAKNAFLSAQVELDNLRD